MKPTFETFETFIIFSVAIGLSICSAMLFYGLTISYRADQALFLLK